MYMRLSIRSDKSIMSTNTRKLQSVLNKMFRVALLFCVLFVASLDAARLSNPLNLGNGRLRSSMMQRQNAEFGEGMRDWFRNTRDRISNQMRSMNLFDLNSSPMTRLLNNNRESEQMMIQPMNFFLDLSSLKFDPSRDWGFHIGKWYIIRKSDDSDESYDNWKDFFESSSELDSVSSARDSDIFEVEQPKTTSVSSQKSVEENETTDNRSVEVLKPLM